MSQRITQFLQSSSKLFWLTVLTLTLALFFAGSSSTQANTAQNASKAAGTTITVTITPGANPDDPPSAIPASVEVGKDDEVQWICSTGCDFYVAFLDPAKKPFKDRTFHKGKNKSGKPTGKDGQYKYSVMVGGGVLDPDVIIKGSGN